MNEVLLVPTGVANLASVQAAFARLGVAARPCDQHGELEHAAAVVLPGVGAFAAGAETLRRLGLFELLTERILAGRGTLAICLGMQLCCEASEESPGVRGLGVVPATVRALPQSVQSPQIGWNRVTPVGTPWCRSGYAYFANSYRLVDRPAGFDLATTDYGGTFVSALRRGAAWLCQFHPEISGEYGAQWLREWLSCCREKVSC